jgi:electron transfer flavoprotein beta subunit
MNIVICVNYVPDTEAKVKVGADGKTIDPAGVNFILNPYDEFAIEAGLKLKEQNGGQTIAITLGGDSGKEALRKALAMGVDKAILLKDQAAGARDSSSIAGALADEIKKLSPDCILFGKQSIDYYDELLPGLVAEMLGMPSVSCIVKLDLQNGTLTCEREIEGGHEMVVTKLPAVLSAQKGLNEPRYPSLKGIMSAKTKPIEEKPAAAIPSVVEVLSMNKPVSKQPGRIIGTDASVVPELVRLLREEAKVL